MSPETRIRDLGDLRPLVDTAWTVPVIYLAAIAGADWLALNRAFPATGIALLLAIIAIVRWRGDAVLPLVFLAGIHVVGFHVGIVAIAPDLVLVLLIAMLLRLAPDPIAALAASRNARPQGLDAGFALAIAAFVYTFAVLPPLQLHFHGGASELLLVLFAAFALCRRIAWFFAGLAALALADLFVANLVVFDCRVIENPILTIRTASSASHAVGMALTVAAIAGLVRTFLSGPYRPPRAVTVALCLLPVLIIIAPHLWIGFANPLRLFGFGEAYTRISSALLHRADVFWLAAALGLAAVPWRGPLVRLAPVVLFVVSCVAGAALAPTVETLLDGSPFAQVDPSAARFMADLGPISLGLDLTGMTAANGWTQLLVTLVAGLLGGAALGGILAGFGAAGGVARITTRAVGDLFSPDGGGLATKSAMQPAGESAWQDRHDATRPRPASDWQQRVADAERGLAATGRSPFEILFGRRVMFAAIAAFLAGTVTLVTAETAVRAGMFRFPAVEEPKSGAPSSAPISGRCQRYLREVPPEYPGQIPLDGSKGGDGGTPLPDLIPEPQQQQQEQQQLLESDPRPLPPAIDTPRLPSGRNGGATAD